MAARRSLVLVLALVTAGCLGAADLEEPGDRLVPVPEVGPDMQLTPEGDSASEVAIAVDPTDPAHVVAAANTAGREEDGFDIYQSWDAGASWNASFYPASQVSTTPTGHPRFQSVSDPVVAFGPDGTLYLAGLAFLPTSAVFVAVSDTGEAGTWDRSHVVEESDLVTGFNDKEWLAVSPATGTLVMAWQKEPAMDQLRSVEQATGLDVDVGDIVVTRSTDQARTWSRLHEVDRGMHNNGTQVAIGEDGVVHMLWVNYEADTLDYVRSEDDGETWSQPVAVADVDTVPAFPRYQRMHTLPALAVSPQGDALYAVWHDDRYGDADVLAVASPDGGASWGDPVRVNQDARGNGVIQMYPWAAVDPQGALHVTFYDSSVDPDHPRFEYVHAWAPGPALTFSETVAVSSEPFTAFDEPGCSQVEACQEHRSLGDYTGLAAGPAGVFPAWADGRGERSVIFSATVELPAGG